MGYVDIDPVLREGFLRTLPFDWSELKIQSVAEIAFLTDALRHGVGPHGLSIPIRSKHGHRGLFSISFSRSEREWVKFRENSLSLLIQVANRLHQRVVSEVFGEDRPHLTPREIECLSWIAQGKSSSDIAVILNISPHTVRDFLKSARFKLDCVSSAQAVNKAVTSGFWSFEPRQARIAPVLGDEVDAGGPANLTKMGVARCIQPIANTTKTGLKILSELN